MPSPTRTHPLDTEKPGVSPANRSLERGIEILRSFRPGSELLGNAELAERTGLSRATVSRLTQTLVGMGYLQAEPRSRAYRLAPAVLSLAHAMRTGSTALGIAAPFMRDAAQAHRLNVGLAAPDRDEMVYLESIRYNRRPSLRTVVSGQRVPMELTSLGRAYLASAPQARREALLAHFRRLRRAQWPVLGPALAAAVREVEATGCCAAAWQPEVVAVATPLVFRGSRYALNMSLSTPEPLAAVVGEVAPLLLALKARIQHGLDLATHD
uniref:IclR family transcriptional regulator n=1 Tax=unclassified Variovorax TaxID=663243 RepID=UPI000D35926C